MRDLHFHLPLASSFPPSLLSLSLSLQPPLLHGGSSQGVATSLPAMCLPTTVNEATALPPTCSSCYSLLLTGSIGEWWSAAPQRCVVYRRTHTVNCIQPHTVNTMGGIELIHGWKWTQLWRGHHLPTSGSASLLNIHVGEVSRSSSLGQADGLPNPAETTRGQVFIVHAAGPCLWLTTTFPICFTGRKPYFHGCK